METLERRKMPVTIRHIKGAELPQSLQNKFNVKPHQALTITVRIEEEGAEELDTVNVGDDIIESLNEIIEAKQQGRELPNARDLLNSL